jgi:predicted ATPase
MKKLFDDRESINVEIFGGTPSLFASLKYRNRKYPIHILSDGMNKIAAILLGIASKPKGIFMVDEIESGLYFKRQNPILSRMREMANENETQIFASTHSLEFLNALKPIMSKHPDDFSLVRVYKDKEDGWGRATILQGEEAITLIKSGLEIRM